MGVLVSWRFCADNECCSLVCDGFFFGVKRVLVGVLKFILCMELTYIISLFFLCKKKKKLSIKSYISYLFMFVWIYSSTDPFHEVNKRIDKCVQVEDAVGSHACTPSHVFTPYSQHESVPITQGMSQFENARCQLLHWYANDDFEDQIVAEGGISSTNPKDKVHNIPFGRGY
ncbi:hypothetical protein ACOSQ2_014747 [Xanthoceras sorbifolium]